MERSVWAAARTGNVTCLRALLSWEAEVSVDEPDDNLVTPLMVRLVSCTLSSF